jgi:hypothetical protein
MKGELRQLIADLDKAESNMFGDFQLPNYVKKYNKILEQLQVNNPTNSLIQTKIPLSYNSFLGGCTIKDIRSNALSILGSLCQEPKTSTQSINITIGSLHGNFSVDNLISTIQNSNIGNSTEIVCSLKEFRQELDKEKPDTDKLKRIINKVESLGDGVISALLIEAGKRFLGI